jgi:hypothetical protein
LTCRAFQIDAFPAFILSEHGISLTDYAVVAVALLMLLWITAFGLGAVIIWRAGADRGALVTAYFLVTYPLAITSAWGLFPAALPAPLQVYLYIIPVLAFFVFLLLFPDGHFVPQWTRWTAVLMALLAAAAYLLPLDYLWAVVILTPFPLIALVGGQIYRYRSSSSPRQRQQTKWGLYGLAVSTLGLASLMYLSSMTYSPSGPTLTATALNLLLVADVMVIPICLSVAVLRSHLWDVDRLINQTLVYLTLTVFLGAIYVGLVLSLQGLSHVLVGRGSDVAVAVSTLAIAGLFRPFRGTIQRAIDRRFYRGRYDAQRTLSDLSERVRDHVELSQLADDLEGVLIRTLHPQGLGWWLSDGSMRHRPPSGDVAATVEMQAVSATLAPLQPEGDGLASLAALTPQTS